MVNSKKLLSLYLLILVLVLGCKKIEKNTVRIIIDSNQENYTKFSLEVLSVQIEYLSSKGQMQNYTMLLNSESIDFTSDYEWLLASKNDLKDGKVKMVRIIFNKDGYFERNGVMHPIYNERMAIMPIDVNVSGKLIDISLIFHLEESIKDVNGKFYLVPIFSLK